MGRENEEENIEIEVQSRTKRNQELYQQINQNDLGDFKVNPNASVLNVDGNEINIDKLRQILDKKYREPEKIKSIDIDTNAYDQDQKPEATKEYDLDLFLAKAKENKDVSYEEQRLKKISDTQFSILKSITVKQEESSREKAEDELQTLIAEVNKNGIDEDDEEGNALDLLSDLKSDDEEEEELITSADLDLTNSFYTGNLKVDPKDYEEEFTDLKKEMSSNSVLVKIPLVIFFIIVLFGVAFFLDKTFMWGIF